jgi:methionyl-tRNA formyltransferase
MKIVFMGSPAFAQQTLLSLMSNNYDISAVFTQPDKKTGRGQQVMACPVKQFAVAHGLNVIQPETFRDPGEVEKLKDLAPDLIVVSAYGQILPDDVLQIPQYKCINIHPSMLPKYRGPSPVTAAILNGDATTGVTIMLVEKKVDSGPILMQKEMIVSGEDTTGTLTEKLAVLGADMLVEIIPDWVAGKIQPLRQDESQASYTRLENKEDGKLNWSLSAVEISRMVRAYQPWPGCFTTLNNVRLKIIKAVPLQDAPPGKTGEIVALPRNGPARVAVCTGNGLLGLVTVQLEGKKEMPAADFVAGHRDFIGSIL